MYFSVEDELFQVDVRQPRVESKHPGYINYLCKPINVKSDPITNSNNDSNNNNNPLDTDNTNLAMTATNPTGGMIFKRFVLQIRAEKGDDQLPPDHPYVENGTVLSQAIEFLKKKKHRESLQKIGESPLLIYNTSAHLRTNIVPTLSQYYQKKWEETKNTQ